MNTRIGWIIGALVSFALPAHRIVQGADARVSPEPVAQWQSVRDFGARGDGVADDTAALQRAADRGGEIRFVRGTYRITVPITIDLDRVGTTSVVSDGTATIRMCGPGPALRFVGTHAGTASPDSVKEAVWARQRTPMIDGIEIVGGHPEAVGILLEGVMQPVLTRVTVREALHGVVVTGRARNVTIGECNLYNNRGAGLLLERLNLHQIDVANCHVSYNLGGGIVVRQSEIRNLQIGSCDIEANMGSDGPASANVLLDASEGSIREGAIVGCTLQHGGATSGGANIRFLGRSVQEPHKVGYFSISANHLSDTDLNVHLVHARGVVLDGNTFGGGTSRDLLFEDCSQVVIGANLFDRNPDYPAGPRGGLLFVDCSDCTFQALQVFRATRDDGALVLRRCRRVNLTDSTILDSDGCGILLEGCASVRVSDCLVRDDRPGAKRSVALRVVGGRGNMVVNNLLAGEVEPGAAVVEGNRSGD